MSRPPNPALRAELLQRAVAWVLAHGLTDLSLRPLAAGLDTSARMMLYHFGSKEQLIVEVLTVIAQQQQLLLSNASLDETDPSVRLEELWVQLTSPALIPFLRSLFEVELRAMDGDPIYQRFAQESLHAWLELVRATLRTEDAATANFVLSAFTGLLIDRFSTGEIERTNTAFSALKAVLRKGGIV
jgi:AcrR family transcriptional regulator